MVITETSFPRGGVVQKKQTDKSIVSKMILIASYVN